ncbi:chemotaxis protein CheW [Luteimonas sp. S4-F44]|uniref:chemotaxis protein CheW n=1 Tax=Luteimonas sp. S4-F44 TaxID=2925842 RepID=UPI001F53D006|nr:chemotaxis protein CheW [Luteimonas sp. S4-F44]UNK43941.1 chemotaxis protein CheW [Luteimonas sp. S4-F44]
MNAAEVVDDYLGVLLSAAPVPTAPAPTPPPAVAAPPVPAPHSPTPAPTSAPPPPAPAAPQPRPPAPAARAQTAAAAAPARASPRVASAPAHDDIPPPRRSGERQARWLRLRCGGQIYGLELLKIREVVLPAPLLPVRGASPCLAGLMNLRGQVVPVVDLGLQLGDTAVEDTPSTRIVVLEEHGDTLGLRVSTVEDVAVVSDAQIEGAHTSRLAPVGDHRIRGIARLGGAVMLLLDASRLLSMPLYTAR